METLLSYYDNELGYWWGIFKQLGISKAILLLYHCNSISDWLDCLHAGHMCPVGSSIWRDWTALCWGCKDCHPSQKQSSFTALLLKIFRAPTLSHFSPVSCVSFSNTTLLSKIKFYPLPAVAGKTSTVTEYAVLNFSDFHTIWNQFISSYICLQILGYRQQIILFIYFFIIFLLCYH